MSRQILSPSPSLMHTRAPIFIVGVNRSGTTLLRLILNAHPHIAIPEELNYFNPWIDAHWQERADDIEGFRRRVHWYLHEKLPAGVLPGIDLDSLEDEIVARGNELGVPFEHTWSCYQNGTEPCGVCASCEERARGFEEAGVVDPVS